MGLEDEGGQEVTVARLCEYCKNAEDGRTMGRWMCYGYTRIHEFYLSVCFSFTFVVLRSWDAGARFEG